MIIVRLSGGMGNQMFQYALARALSLEYKTTLKLDTTFLMHRIQMPQWLRPGFSFRGYDLDIFCIEPNFAEKKDMHFWERPIGSGKIMILIDALLRKVPMLRGWEKRFSFDSRVLSLGPNAYLVGFWQSEKYFKKYESVLRNDFKLRNPLPATAQALLVEIESTSSVCMHLRRTDIASSTFHGAVDLTYYTTALAYIAARKKVEKVFVFSDDVEWCKAHVQLTMPTVFVEKTCAGEKGEGHFALMLACSDFIIANSTFSWWAAWLGNRPGKIVVAPKRWFVKGTPSAKDLIPENWIQL